MELNSVKPQSNFNLVDKKTIESIKVRGICAAIQAMQYPSFENLQNLLRKFGYELTKT